MSDTGEHGESQGPDGKALTCREAVSRIYEFLDGELEEIDHDAVAEHFRICQLCYPHLTLERSFREAVKRALVKQKAPERVRDRVLKLLDESAD